MEPHKQWEAALSVIRGLRGQLDATGRETQSLLVVGDGDFSVVKLRVSLAEGVVLMSRCPRNRALFFTTTGEGWPEKEMLPVGMGNAVAGSLRG